MATGTIATEHVRPASRCILNGVAFGRPQLSTVNVSKTLDKSENPQRRGDMHIDELKNGAATQTRTGDLRITNAPLYRLSYCGPLGVGPVHNANGR